MVSFLTPGDIVTDPVPWPVLRARIAGLSRDRSADDPDLIAARRDLAAIRLREIVRKRIDTGPTLTADQLDSVVAILRGAHVHG